MNIPKIIHQTWKNNNIPSHWQSSKDKWIEYHPDFEYKLWTDEDNLQFVKLYFPQYLQAYNSFKYNIQRADIIRYMILYIYGGIYCDLDLEPLNNLSDLFNFDGVYILHSNNTPLYYTNAFMASCEKHPFWLRVLEECVKPVPWYYFGKHLQVMYSTGPAMFTRVVNNYNESLILLPNILSCSVCNLKCVNTRTRLKTLKGNSWHEFDSTFYNVILCNWKYIILFLIITILLYIIYKEKMLKKCTLKLHKCERR